MVRAVLLLALLAPSRAGALDPLFVAAENRELIEDLTTRYLPDFTPGMGAAWVYQESRWKVTAVSKAGARGPLQMMPDTARDIRWTCHLPDLDLNNMSSALRGGFCYAGLLRRRIGRMSSVSDLDEAMMRAYNGGAKYILKERDAAKAKGANDGVAANLTPHCRTFRSRNSCEENLRYYPYIMRWYNEFYRAWQ